MVLSMDQAFVQAPEHRPKSTVPEAGSIPVIDLSSLTAAGPHDRALADAIGEACKVWGFFVVVNHGVPKDHVDKAVAAAKAFFALSQEEKAKVRRGDVEPLGYYEAENTKNVRDWKEVFDLVPSEPKVALTGEHLVLKNKWPESIPWFSEALEEYSKSVEELAFKLLELIALSLNLDPKRLNPFFADQTTFTRLNHYPPCPISDLALGVGRHKDAGALTVLYQDDVGGLDVKRRSDDEWVRVKPIPNSFIINVGDIIQVWSNDRYESAEHRVSVNSEKERFSIPYFFNPAPYAMIEPLEEMVSDEDPAKYNVYNWGEFFRTRKGSNFKKLDVENIQISHFRKAQ